MSWVEVSLSVSEDQVGAAEQALEELGSLAITMQDDADNPVLEPAPGATPLWPTVYVRGLFETDVSRSSVVSALQFVPGADRPEAIRWREIDDQDWERAWMDRFEPMQFGDCLWIVPTGMSVPPQHRGDTENIEIHLDPGLAFGTGTHPTTALCLQWIDGHDFAGQTVVDYGCGSGILAIAAALKGAKHVLCVDTDPQALEATRHNAERNNVNDHTETFLPDNFQQEKPNRCADVVLANILAGPLIELVEHITACVRPGGNIVLSGILEEQAILVIETYAAFADSIQQKNLDGWVRLSMTRRP